ncbi:MAG TPA: polysaccharide pyruvyl transferase family protein [Ramlibacter sp.]|nr:polysaccharide pyruvyl transferase family protein [Ramlibacter sp.]
MLTVDAALTSFAHRHPELALDIEHFNVEAPDAVRHASGAWDTETKLLSSLTQVTGHHALVFWGDFLQARAYHHTDIRGRLVAANLETTPVELETKLRSIQDLLLLRGASESLLQKTILFGGTFYVNTPQDERDPYYAPALSRLLASVKRVMMRDPLSAEFADRYAGGRPDSTIGLDAAFLLQPSAEFSWERKSTHAPRDIVGYSFGRGLSRDPAAAEAMMRFTRAVGAAAGCSGSEDIGWLGVRASDMKGVSDRLTLINQCRFVVTDTYHCAVNSMRENIPTLCIGRGVEVPTATLSEKKKEMLFSMLNARNYYFCIEQLQGVAQFRKAVKMAAAAVCDAELAAGLTATINSATSIAEGRLVRALSELPAAT